MLNPPCRIFNEFLIVDCATEKNFLGTIGLCIMIIELAPLRYIVFDYWIIRYN